MHYDICTLFDRRYLSRGLALYRSLVEHCQDFDLWVFCMDTETEVALRRLDLSGLRTVSLAELEAHDPGLLAAKPTRSQTEYFWTLTPATCLYVLDHEPRATIVIRVDADVSFHADPGLAIAELGRDSVLLTPHRVAPEFADSPEEPEKWGGVFNVQFEAFRRDDVGLGALRWWRARCIEWCYDRVEPGRYGDQKYLDELPKRFDGVRTLTQPGAGIGPWNVSAHRLERRGQRVLIDGEPLIFHHYQSLEIHPSTGLTRRLARHTNAYRYMEAAVPLVWTTGWRLREHELDLLWEPYVAKLADAIASLRRTSSEIADPPRIRPTHAAFQIARRRLPGWVRDAYWKIWELIHRHRYPASDPVVEEPTADSRATAAISSTSESESSG
jgi:hypothetical protein